MNFNQKINFLPKNLLHLELVNCFNQKTDKLPKNLNYIKIGWNFQNKIVLPKNIKILSSTDNIFLLNNIPNHVEILHIMLFINNNIIQNLPMTLKEIVISNKYYKKYIKIPFGCILTIQENFNEITI
jgi:hypothetical protein